jgi:hypothetical protein
VWARPNPCAEALVALGHACAQLKNAWAAIEKMSADARRAAIAAYELPRKGGAKSSIKIFSDDEEVTQLLLDGCKGRIATHVGLDAGVRLLNKVLVRCRRCSSIILFVVVINVVVIAYRLSSYSHHRVR